jgi:hypothetical protein
MNICKFKTKDLVLCMDKQMVTGHNPQADAQKTGKALKKGQSQDGNAPSFLFTDSNGKELDLSGYSLKFNITKL